MNMRGFKPWVLKDIPVTTFGIYNKRTNKVEFDIALYGVDKRSCMVVPGGGAKIMQVLQERGLDKTHSTSMFHIR